MPLLGQLALWLALLLGLWGAVIGFAGYRQDRPDLQESARRAVLVLAAALLVAVLSLFMAAWRRDFHLAYVAAHADLTLARRDAIAVLLDGVAGRLLLGAFVLAALLIGVRGSSYATGLGAAIVAAAVATMLFAANPFVLQSFTPVDGLGLSQRLYDLDARLDLALRCVAYPASIVALLTVARHWSPLSAFAERGKGGEDPERGPGAQGWYKLQDAKLHAHTWTLIAWVLLTAELALSLCVALRVDGGGGTLSALWRPALPLWVTFGALLHRWRIPTTFATHVAHAGAVIVAVSVGAATLLDTRDTVRLRAGESAEVSGYALTYLAASVYPARAQIITQGLLDVRRGERALGRVAAVRRQQLDAFGRDRFAPARRAGTLSGMGSTVYVHWAADSSVADAADFVVAVVPLARWLWVGSVVLALGGLAALVTRREGS